MPTEAVLRTAVVALVAAPTLKPKLTNFQQYNNPAISLSLQNYLVKMKQLKFIGILVAVAIAISACKKEEEEPQVFIQKHILGAWPINYNIKTTFTEEVLTKRDTLTIYNPVDTMVFTAEGKAIRRNKTVISTVNYTISTDGETITLATTPTPTTYKFTFVHITSIGLGTETTTTVGGQKITTQVADHLNRK